MTSRSRWSRFVDSAVQGQGTPAAGALQSGPAPAAAGKRPASGRRGAGRIEGHVRTKLRGRERRSAPDAASRRRTDVRLVLPALLVWGAAVAGVWLNPAALLVVCCGVLLVAAALLLRAFRGRALGVHRRSFLMTVAAGLVLAGVAASHASVSASQRHDGALAEAAASRQSVVAVIEVTGAPRSAGLPGHAGNPERWSVPVRTEAVRANGHVIRTRAPLVVMGGGGWGDVVPGQVLRTAGKLKPPGPGRQEAAVLTASLSPAAGARGDGAGQRNAPGWEAAAKELRGRYVAAAAFLAPDPRGLLPGMVTGDTAALDEGLSAAMKTVGLTHLTAVSGANCTLVLGALLLAARSLRISRVPAAGLALAGLWMFVVLVGPDASVLRAALMGAVALASLAGGRTGRGLSLLCVAVIGLLLLDPALGTGFGFLLSVLATLGIIVLGRRMIEWTPPAVPRWAAAAWAVPLSAQLLCGPVIVLLQPQFSTYSLFANIMAAPLVAPVTLLGTAAVPLLPVAPWAATVLIAVAGTFSGGVAGTARLTAGLPGASLPWPEGSFGLVTMVLLSLVTVAGVWLAVRPRQVLRQIVTLHGRTEAMLERSRHLCLCFPGRPIPVVLRFRTHTPRPRTTANLGPRQDGRAWKFPKGLRRRMSVSPRRERRPRPRTRAKHRLPPPRGHRPCGEHSSPDTCHPGAPPPGGLAGRHPTLRHDGTLVVWNSTGSAGTSATRLASTRT